ncbi:WecB/TagA/CpsF family glycosyltransferase [archaeon]|nr:WecB/TagA/CpsF family glycosyltransferase [archaeon]
MDKLIFTELKKTNFEDLLKNKNERVILNFFNLHDLYQFNNLKVFKESVSNKPNINCIDGSLIKNYFSLRYLRKVKQVRGTDFTKSFLDLKIVKNKKHFFIGNVGLREFSKKTKIPEKNLRTYNPPFIKNLIFSEEELKKISSLIKKFSPDFVWVGIGCPKQNILTEELFKRTSVKFFFNVGAALDFLLGKKSEAPKFWRTISLEWLYRLITDFKHSRKKVWRHFLGLRYLNSIELRR